ncbi:uncharacterized protein LOC124259268 [Haliotis rubra]|uniref:uncharacterized protein LOC124259268 n=1 Tax=Haliotis rubra TaxID=36100 RepID=UPI001EE5CECE|nr:uncharacterized protein LOC124259268 [Haliotis rubra]
MATSLKLIVLVIWSSTPGTSLMKTSVTCDPGMYYDFAIGRCDLCDSICDYAEIQGTVLECATKCPDFTSGYKKAKSADTLSKQQTVKGLTTTSTTASGSCGEERRTITMLLIALCGVSLLLILMMVVIIVLTFRRARQHQTGYSVTRTTEPLIRRDGHAQCTTSNGQTLKQPGTSESKSVASERLPVAQFPMSSI